MKKLMLASALAVASLIPSLAFACEGHKQAGASPCDHAQQASVEPKKVSVTELASMTKEKKATPVDANTKDMRQNEGVVPGAILLTSSSQYDLKELPKEKDAKLVFYCASEKCGASHAAAAKAMEAGYTNVAVMPEGIKGWKKAGQPTSKPNS
jgi:rhodanese-related sulfurtransferase